MQIIPTRAAYMTKGLFIAMLPHSKAVQGRRPMSTPCGSARQRWIRVGTRLRVQPPTLYICWCLSVRLPTLVGSICNLCSPLRQPVLPWIQRGAGEFSRNLRFDRGDPSCPCKGSAPLDMSRSAAAACSVSPLSLRSGAALPGLLRGLHSVHPVGLRDV